MDISEIQARIDALPARMTAKGLIRPEVEYILHDNKENGCHIKWRAMGKDKYSDSEYKFFYGKTPSEILKKVEDCISALPSAEETKRDAFLAALGRVIDYGSELGQDVGALVTEMRRISTNALTDQRGEEDAHG